MDGLDATSILARQRRTVFYCVLILSACTFGSYFSRVSLDRDSNIKSDVAALGTIDINTAQWFEIAQLPGIGEKLSRRIVETRELRQRKSGPPAFARPEDIRSVRGIGEKTLRRISPYIRVNPANDSH